MPITIESLWCDDVRSEAGGKLSLMGVYSSQLIVPHEVTLPKLCCYVILKMPIDEPPRAVTIKITKNDNETIVESELQPPEELEEVAAQEPNAKFYSVITALIISPFIIESSISTLRAVAVVNGVELSASGLSIKIQPTEKPAE